MASYFQIPKGTDLGPNVFAGQAPMSGGNVNLQTGLGLPQYNQGRPTQATPTTPASQIPSQPSLSIGQTQWQQPSPPPSNQGNSGDAQGRGGDPSNPLTYLKAVAASGALNPSQRSEYERLLAQEQNRTRPSQPTITVPPSAPPPVMPATSVTTPRGSVTPQSVSPQPQAGTVANMAKTAQSMATQGLQKAKSVLPTVAQALPPVGLIQSLLQHPEIIGKILPQLGLGQQLVAQAEKLPSHPGSWAGLPDIGATEKVGQVLGAMAGTPFGRTPQGGSSLRGAVGIPGMGVAPQVQAEIGPTGGFQKISPTTGKVTPTPKGQTSATTQEVLGSVQTPKEQENLVNMALSGKANTNDVIAGIAGEQGLKTLNKMIDKAQKSGDMDMVTRLANIHTGVARQIQFNNVLQQAIMAVASGFGTPNAPGITQARLPGIQQAAGAQLETPLAAQTPTPQGAEGSPISYLPPQFQGVNTTQQNRPVLNPWMQGA